LYRKNLSKATQEVSNVRQIHEKEDDLVIEEMFEN